MTPSLASMAFFDSDLSLEEKRELVLRLSVEGELDNESRKLSMRLTDVSLVCENNVSQFITKQSLNFFQT